MSKNVVGQRETSYTNRKIIFVVIFVNTMR